MDEQQHHGTPRTAVSNATGTSGTQTLTIGGAGNTTVGGVMSNNAGTLALTMSGSGNFTFNGSAVNTFSGGVNGGTPVPTSRTGHADGFINNGNSLTMGGGMLSILGKNVASATSSQTFNGTTLNAGSNIIAINKGASATSATLHSGSRNPGSAVNFQPNSLDGNPVGPRNRQNHRRHYDGVSCTRFRGPARSMGRRLLGGHWQRHSLYIQINSRPVRSGAQFDMD